MYKTLPKFTVTVVKNKRLLRKHFPLPSETSMLVAVDFVSSAKMWESIPNKWKLFWIWLDYQMKILKCFRQTLVLCVRIENVLSFIRFILCCICVMCTNLYGRTDFLRINSIYMHRLGFWYQKETTASLHK